MMKFYLTTFLLFYFYTIHAQLQSVIGETKYPFWLNLPAEISMDQKQPLLVFLHGKSLSGTDLNRVKRYGVIRAIENGKKIPAIVVAPQLPSGPWNPDTVLELINHIQTKHNIDANRIYVCGMSLGGYGTLHFVGKYPDKVAAAVAICGGGNVKDAPNLSKVPLLIQHGDKDFIVPLSESQKVVNAVKNFNPMAPITFQIIPGGDHGTVENSFRTNEIYEWMFSRTKEYDFSEFEW
jgi:predicted peptidase